MITTETVIVVEEDDQTTYLTFGTKARNVTPESLKQDQIGTTSLDDRTVEVYRRQDQYYALAYFRRPSAGSLYTMDVLNKTKTLPERN